MLIWYELKYLHCFGSEGGSFVLVLLKPNISSNFTLCLQTQLFSCQLCIDSHVRHSAMKSQHTAVGQQLSHTEPVPVPLYQTLLKYNFMSKRCGINSNSEYEGIQESWYYLYRTKSFSFLPGFFFFFLFGDLGNSSQNDKFTENSVSIRMSWLHKYT